MRLGILLKQQKVCIFIGINWAELKMTFWYHFGIMTYGNMNTSGASFGTLTSSAGKP